MKEVTQAQFFSRLHAEEEKGKDIMPGMFSSTYPYRSEWRDQKSAGRELFGVTEGDQVHPFKSTGKFFVV